MRLYLSGNSENHVPLATWNVTDVDELSFLLHCTCTLVTPICSIFNMRTVYLLQEDWLALSRGDLGCLVYSFHWKSCGEVHTCLREVLRVV